MAISTYWLFGEWIISNRPLLGLRPIAPLSAYPEGVRLNLDETATGPLADLAFWAHSQPEVLLPGPPRVTRWTHTSLEEGAFLRLRYSYDARWVDFVINESGTEVWANSGTGTDLSDVTTLFVGPVFGCILRLRGVIGLHASVVNWDERAFLLIGPSGAGKSTTAAGLIELGCHPWADDLAVLNTNKETLRVPPGYFRLRLYSHVAKQLYGGSAELTPLWSGDMGMPAKGYRNYFECDNAAAQNPIPLAGIYLLHPSAQVQRAVITLLSPGEALPRLIQETVCRWALDQKGRANEFRTLSRLVAETPVYQVQRPLDMTTLMDTCQIILANVRKG